MNHCSAKAIYKLCRWVIGFMIILAGMPLAFAAPSALTYQGRILKSDGTALEYKSVSFIFQITDPSGACVLYQEQVDGYDMTNSGGVFDTAIGTGSRTFPASGVFTVIDSLNNNALLGCQGGSSYLPSIDDGRKLRVQFFDGVGWKSVSPDNVIRSVPYAGYSASSAKLGTNVASDFVLKSDINNSGSGTTSCNAGSFLTWDASTLKFGCAVASGTGTGTVTSVSSANSYLSITNPTVTPIFTVNVGTTSGTVAAGNDSRIVGAMQSGATAGGDLSGTYPNPTVSKIKGYGLDFATAPSTGQVLQFDGTNFVPVTLAATSSGTVTSITAGTGLTGSTITTSGTIGLGTELTGLNGISTTGYINRTASGTYSTSAASTTASTNTLVQRNGSGISGFYGVDIAGSSSGIVSLLSPSIVTSYSLTFPNAQGSNGQVLVNNGSGTMSWSNVPSAPGSACGAGNVITYNGTAFTCVPDQVGASGGGITTLNGESGSSQSFAIGTSGTAPTWSSASDVHTLNIPMANTASVTAGLISKTEYDVFNGKQTALGYTPLNPANNLSELTSTAATARTNLGLGTAATKNVAASGNAATTEVVMGNDTRLTDGRAPSGTASGDLSGTYPSPTVAKLSGVAFSISSLTSGQYLKYNGTNWVNSVIAQTDVSGLSTALSGKIDQSQISGTCSSSKTLTFSSVTGTWTCSNISIADSQIVYGSETAKTFLAAPISGAGTPTFRAIDVTDLPSSITDATWTAASGNVYRATGNVGIGTNSPSYLIDANASSTATYNSSSSSVVAPNLTTDPVLRVVNSSGTLNSAAYINLQTAQSASQQLAYIGAVSHSSSFSPDLVFGGRSGTTAYSEYMRISNLGNVGIGTISPSGILHAAASAYASTALLERSGQTTDNIVAAFRVKSTKTTDMGDGFGSGIGFTIQDDAGVENSIGLIGAVRDGADGNGDFVFRPSTAGSNIERMRIMYNGNVGIGTTSPTTALQVNGTITATAFSGPVTATTTSSGTGSAGTPSMTFSGDSDTGFYDASSNNLISVAAGGVKIWDLSSSGIVSPTTGGADITTAAGTAAAPTYSFAGDAGTGWWRPAASTMAASTGGVERMRIDSSGNVGIGTTSSTNVLTTERDQNSNSTIYSLNYTVGTASVAGFGLNSDTSAARLDVYSSGYTPINVFDRANSVALWTNANATGGLSFSARNAASGIMTFHTGGNTERMRIDQNGNVGIGTTSPGSALDVRGSVYGGNYTSGDYSSMAATRLDLYRTSNTVVYLGSRTAGNDLQVQTTTSGGVLNSNLTVTSSGSVGIGTTSPSNKFQVYEASSSATTGIRLDFAPALTADPNGNLVSTFNQFSDSTTQNITGNAYGSVNRSIFTSSSSGTVLGAIGSQGDVYNQGAVVMTTATGAVAGVNNTSTGTITTARGFATSIVNSGSGSIGTGYGVYVASPSVSSGSMGTYYGVFIGSPTAATTNYALYSAGGANYLGGITGIGTTSATGKLEVNSGAANALTGVVVSTTSAGTNTYVSFKAGASTIGSISSPSAGTSVAYNTTSDVRLKGGFQPVASPLKTLNDVEVTNFYYLADPAHRMDGFKAQQLYQVLPYAVTKPAEEVDDKGKIIPWLADYSKVVPLVAAAVQELYGKWMNDSQQIHRSIASVEAENKDLKAQMEIQRKENADIKVRLEKLEKLLQGH